MTVIAAKVRDGRVHRQIRRCLIVHGGKPVTITDLLNYCYPRSRKHPAWRRKSIHRALPRYAVLLGRMGCGSGGPGIYGPNAELMRLIRAT
jgi:hypothetical protein